MLSKKGRRGSCGIQIFLNRKKLFFLGILLSVDGHCQQIGGEKLSWPFSSTSWPSSSSSSSVCRGTGGGDRNGTVLQASLTANHIGIIIISQQHRGSRTLVPSHMWGFVSSHGHTWQKNTHFHPFSPIFIHFHPLQHHEVPWYTLRSPWDLVL